MSWYGPGSASAEWTTSRTSSNAAVSHSLTGRPKIETVWLIFILGCWRVGAERRGPCGGWAKAGRRLGRAEARAGAVRRAVRRRCGQRDRHRRRHLAGERRAIVDRGRSPGEGESPHTEGVPERGRVPTQKGTLDNRTSLSSDAMATRYATRSKGADVVADVRGTLSKTAFARTAPPATALPTLSRTAPARTAATRTAATRTASSRTASSKTVSSRTACRQVRAHTPITRCRPHPSNPPRAAASPRQTHTHTHPSLQRRSLKTAWPSPGGTDGHVVARDDGGRVRESTLRGRAPLSGRREGLAWHFRVPTRSILVTVPEDRLTFGGETDGHVVARDDGERVRDGTMSGLAPLAGATDFVVGLGPPPPPCSVLWGPGQDIVPKKKTAARARFTLLVSCLIPQVVPDAPDAVAPSDPPDPLDPPAVPRADLPGADWQVGGGIRMQLPTCHDLPNPGARMERLEPSSPLGVPDSGCFSDSFGRVGRATTPVFISRTQWPLSIFSCLYDSSAACRSGRSPCDSIFFTSSNAFMSYILGPAIL